MRELVRFLRNVVVIWLVAVAGFVLLVSTASALVQTGTTPVVLPAAVAKISMELGQALMTLAARSEAGRSAFEGDVWGTWIWLLFVVATLLWVAIRLVDVVLTVAAGVVWFALGQCYRVIRKRQPRAASARAIHGLSR